MSDNGNSNGIDLVIRTRTKDAAAEVKTFSQQVVDRMRELSNRSIDHLMKLESRMIKGLGGAIGWVSGKLVDLSTGAIKGFGGAVGWIADKLMQLGGGMVSGVGGAISWLGGALFNLKTLAMGALTGWGLKQLAMDFFAVGSAMDQLKMGLNTITKGQGEEWFDALNRWAMKMPVNTRSAIESFRMMRAMGLQPTIDQMTVLVDTMSALGGNEETLQGIARAMGQMQTKGKASAEELMQLAERGVPAYEILKEKLHLTGAQVANIGDLAISSDKVIAALFEGMKERYGGQSEQIAGRAKGLIESLQAYWEEFKRLVMDSGVMTYVETKLARLDAMVGGWYKSGQLQRYAQELADRVIGAMQWISIKVQELYRWWRENQTQLLATYNEYMPLIRQAVGDALQWVWDRVSEVYGWWMQNKDDLLAKYNEYMPLIRQAVGDALQWIQDKVQGLYWWWQDNQDQLLAIYNEYMPQIQQAVGDALQWIWDAAGDVYDWWIKNNDDVKAAVIRLVGEIRGAAQWVQKHAEDIWDVAKGLGAVYAAAKALQFGSLLVTTFRSAAVAADLLATALWGVQAAATAGLAALALYAGYKIGEFFDPQISRWNRVANEARQETARIRSGMAAHADVASYGEDSYASGSRYIPRDGLVKVHRSEAILAPDEADRYRRAEAVDTGLPRASAAGVTIGDIHIHLPSGAEPRNDTDWRRVVRDFIAPELRLMRVA